MKLLNKDGIEMMDVKSIDLDGDRLVLKGKMMGSMSTTIYVHPHDLWSAVRLLRFSIVVRLPRMLAKGYWSERVRRRLYDKTLR
jgi:hypothetical protein